MARVARAKIDIIIRASNYIADNIAAGNIKLEEERDPQSKLKTAYKSTLKDGANTDIINSLKMFRWLIKDLQLTSPSAYTDSEVDSIDEDIRTKEN